MIYTVVPAKPKHETLDKKKLIFLGITYIIKYTTNEMCYKFKNQ